VVDSRIAVLLPAYNEQVAIGRVIQAFQAVLPQAAIYVYDNNSTDQTVAIARGCGAIVRHEARQGKGHVVRRMFADVDAEIYVMCDADDTYDVSTAQKLVRRLVDEHLDMVVGIRQSMSKTAYRPAHEFGNWMLTGLVRTIFGNEFHDMLSGYRIFSRRFVKSFPVMSQGFEIETELTIHALELEMPSVEVPIQFKERLAGSQSKLNTIGDGWQILWTIAALLKQERPMQLFSTIGALFILASVIIAYPLLTEFWATGLVPRLPTAVLSTGLMLLGWLCLFTGLILDTVTRGRQEIKRLRYLSLPSAMPEGCNELTNNTDVRSVGT
jgi:glycosyltransferase involved in cell wall biosynthesis